MSYLEAEGNATHADLSRPTVAYLRWTIWNILTTTITGRQRSSLTSFGGIISWKKEKNINKIKAGHRSEPCNRNYCKALTILAWKSKQKMNSLRVLLFSEKLNQKNTRLAESKKISLPVPGFPTLPSNFMAKIWNSIPGSHTATTLGSAKSLVNKWAKTIPR